MLRAVPAVPERAVGLIRVSKERDGMLSPELQRVAIEDHAARTGRHVVAWLEGLDESGSQARSPWWARLDEAVGMVENRQVDAVLVWKFSRTARHRRRWAVALDRVETAGGTLESATEDVDVRTSTGRLTRGMLAELAAWEAERIGEQWKETHAHRIARGLPHTGVPRFGYVYDKGTGYTPDPGTAPIVAELYARYNAGDGLRALTTWLAALGVKSPKSKKTYTWRGVSYYLGSGFAAGLLSVHDPGCRCGKPSACLRKVHVPGAQPPIITEAVWVEYQRQQKARAMTPARHRSPTTPLAGLVICAHCGYRMRSKWGPDGPGYLYECEHPTCKRVSVTRARCEQVVLDWLRQEVAGEVEARAALTASHRVSTTVARTEAEHLARQVQRLDDALTRLTKDRAMGLVPEQAYATARDELVAEREQAAEALEAASLTVSRPGPDIAVAVRLIEDWDVLPVPDRRRMLEPLVRVRVTKGKPRPVIEVVPAWVV